MRSGAPRPNYPDWKGLGMQWAPAPPPRAARRRLGSSSTSTPYTRERLVRDREAQRYKNRYIVMVNRLRRSATATYSYMGWFDVRLVRFGFARLTASQVSQPPCSDGTAHHGMVWLAFWLAPLPALTFDTTSQPLRRYPFYARCDGAPSSLAAASRHHAHSCIGCHVCTARRAT